MCVFTGWFKDTAASFMDVHVMGTEMLQPHEDCLYMWSRKFCRDWREMGPEFYLAFKCAFIPLHCTWICMYEIVGNERLNGYALTSVVDDVRSNVPCTTLAVSLQLSKINDFVDWICHNTGRDIHISPNIQMARYRDLGLTCLHNWTLRSKHLRFSLL